MHKSNQKGSLLERAVTAIEQTILAQSPNLSTAALRVEMRKVIVVDGVRHEIDLWVEAEIAKDYRTIFLFECKNWEDKVGKNEIIIFSEKVRALSAQRGFFVAKRFTADAIAQAALDRRIKLLFATEASNESLAPPVGYEVLLMNPHKGNLEIYEHGRGTFGDTTPFDLDRAHVTIDGVQTNLVVYVDQWAVQKREERMRTFPSAKMPSGLHEVDIADERVFTAGALRINDRDIERLVLKAKFPVRIARPTVVSHFEVDGRGRYWELEPVPMPGGGQLEHSFVTAVGPDEGAGGR